MHSSSSSLRHIYAVPPRRHFPDFLRSLYAVNRKLRSEGVLAPGVESVENMKTLYKAIGSPIDDIPTIHVGGTNGKGSTSFKLAQYLKATGLKTGLFVSPHLSSYRERAQVNDQPLSEEEMMDHLTTIYNLCSSRGIPATEFEISLLLASLHFRKHSCEAVVLEVGCGGRFDATNVVSTALSIVCSVSLDHMRILGSTVEAIAENKAGIFKRGIPALVGPGVPLQVMRQAALDAHAPLYSFDEAWDRYEGHMQALGFARKPQDTDELNAQLSMLGLCLLREHASACASLQLEDPMLARSLSLRPPCRWQKLEYCHEGRTVEVILDVGHNPAAIAALVQRMQREYADRRVRMIYAMSRDKDVRECLRTIALAIPADRIHFAQSKNWRAVSVEGLEAIFFEETGQTLAHCDDATVDATVHRILQLTAHEGDHGVVIICGTGYIMPPARSILGIHEPRDDVDLVM